MRSYAHAIQAGELLKLDADKAGETKKENPDGKTKWVSVQSKYFIAAISIYVQQKITPQQSGAMADQMKIMTYIFPIMMLLFFNNLPAGLGLYYLMFNVFGLIQQVYTNMTLPKTAAKPVQAVSPNGAKKKKKEKVA